MSKTLIRKSLLFVVVMGNMLLTQLSIAAAPVWKVEKNGNALYLGGTIHMLAPKDYPLPEAFEVAYKASEEIVFEIDIERMNSPEVQLMLMSKVMYTDGRTLKSALNEKVLADLDAHFRSRGVPLDTMINFKPGMLSVMMTMFELQRLGLDGTGVDEFYSDKAKKEGKRLGQLEKIEEQITMLATMGEGEENELIAYTLRDVGQLASLMKEMKAAWRIGDMAQFEKMYIGELKKEFPKAYDELLTKRNRAWIPKLEAMMKTKPVEFVLAGALHMAGEDGVIVALEKRGYTITQLK